MLSTGHLITCSPWRNLLLDNPIKLRFVYFLLLIGPELADLGNSSETRHKSDLQLPSHLVSEVEVVTSTDCQTALCQAACGWLLKLPDMESEAPIFSKINNQQGLLKSSARHNSIAAFFIPAFHSSCLQHQIYNSFTKQELTNSVVNFPWFWVKMASAVLMRAKTLNVIYMFLNSDG